MRVYALPSTHSTIFLGFAKCVSCVLKPCFLGGWAHSQALDCHHNKQDQYASTTGHCSLVCTHSVFESCVSSLSVQEVDLASLVAVPLPVPLNTLTVCLFHSTSCPHGRLQLPRRLHPNQLGLPNRPLHQQNSVKSRNFLTTTTAKQYTNSWTKRSQRKPL